MKRQLLIIILIVLLIGFFIRQKGKRNDILVDQNPTPTLSREERDTTTPPTIIKRGAGRGEYSPDGTQILFHQKGEDGRYDVYVMDAQGGNERCVTCNYDSFAQSHAGNASWHPEGKIITFQAEKESHIEFPGTRALTHPGMGWFNDIWVGTVDGTHFTRVTDAPVKQGFLDAEPFTVVLHPHFSPDGKKISWGQTTNAGIRGWNAWSIVVGDIAITNSTPTVSNLTYFTPQNTNGEYYESDDFDQSGSTILISANLEEQQHPFGMDIYAFDIAENTVTQLTDSLTHWDEAAIYSPDYTRIVWLSSTGYEFDAQDRGAWWVEGKADFWIMDADGSNKRQITFFNKPGTPDYELVEGVRVIPAYIEWHPDGKSVLASISVMREDGAEDMIVKIEL